MIWYQPIGSEAGEVTAVRLAESNGSLPPGLWFQLPDEDRDQLQNTMLVSSMRLPLSPNSTTLICCGFVQLAL